MKSKIDHLKRQQSPKGTWIRQFHPHVEGKLVKGFNGLKVGQKLKARLTHIILNLVLSILSELIKFNI